MYIQTAVKIMIALIHSYDNPLRAKILLLPLRPKIDA